MPPVQEPKRPALRPWILGIFLIAAAIAAATLGLFGLLPLLREFPFAATIDYYDGPELYVWILLANLAIVACFGCAIALVLVRKGRAAWTATVLGLVTGWVGLTLLVVYAEGTAARFPVKVRYDAPPAFPLNEAAVEAADAARAVAIAKSLQAGNTAASEIFECYLMDVFDDEPPFFTLGPRGSIDDSVLLAHDRDIRAVGRYDAVPRGEMPPDYAEIVQAYCSNGAVTADVMAAFARAESQYRYWKANGNAMERAGPANYWAPEPTQSRGLASYKVNCEVCHANGEAQGPIKGLATSALLASPDPRQTVAVIVHGSGKGAMPAWRHLPNEEIADLATYIRHRWGPRDAQVVMPSLVIAVR